jgi:hypothetical protein
MILSHAVSMAYVRSEASAINPMLQHVMLSVDVIGVAVGLGTGGKPRPRSVPPTGP